MFASAPRFAHRWLLTALALSLAPACTASTGSTAPATPAPMPEPGICLRSCEDPSEAAEGEEAAKWEVDKPPGVDGGDFEDVAIDTTEGTWMSVDVSPDGTELLFDLLGDIYALPIAGGEAKALTSGISWDMQPRYSPDGNWIAFTSDRGGGDNIWVMRRDGSNLRPVTKEDFRLLNSPVWSPDGRYIAARKHFTKHRSLGAGEIWLYHSSGGGGAQLTKKQNDQKDVGEPAFSHDGRYVYYSRDATPGKYFEYNKDPNPGIYAIERLDLETGRTERFLGGAGGAIRPTPSPDGKSLAFIRRVRTQSVLYVVDLESGEERPLYAGLDRDMQETWAIHGVYPTMAWLPDNSAIIVWAGGKLHRVELKDGAVRDIPFHVAGTRRVAKALRKLVPVAPLEVDVKVLRWPQVSPDGKRVVYQALGHLYVRDLPDGTPKRLTKQSDHFEFYPSFSRDGKSIVYTTWDDEELGEVRVIPARGGRSKVVTREPGHYIEPVFAPDGKSVVYRKVGGGWMRSPTWSRDQGLYLAQIKGLKKQPPVRVSAKGHSPQFAASGDRLLYTVSSSDKDGNDSTKLMSVGLGAGVDGHSVRTHLTTHLATEFSVSPDGRWVAWVEGYKVHVAPLTMTGDKPIKLGPKATGVPIATVTKEVGQFIHWSGDSQRLHWVHGPELFTRELKDVFPFLGGAAAGEKPPEPLAIGQGRNISFKQPADAPTGAVALTNVRVITMRRTVPDEVLENATILIQGNKIQSVGPAAQVKVPPEAFVINAEGSTVIPGLVDVHAHGAQGRQGIIPQQNWLHYAELAFGVTTVHDPSNDTNTIFAAAEMAAAGLITAPRIFSTGTILYGALAPFKADINNLDDARGHLARMKAVGAISVKSYNQPRREQRQQVIAAGRELGVMVVPEGGSLFHHNMTMVVDGHTGVEHCLPVARAYSDVFQLWGKTQVGYTPTLGVAYGGLGGENYWYAHTEVWEHDRLNTFVPRFAVDPRSRRRTMAPDDDWNHISAAALAKKLIDAGGKVQIGAHGQREGLAAHWEIWMLAQGGMTPLEALRAATLHGAEYVGLDAEIGSIEQGKLADLVVLESNPLDDIRNTDSVRYTILNGRVYDARTMDELGSRPRKRAPFFFEKNQAIPGIAAPPEARCHHGVGPGAE